MIHCLLRCFGLLITGVVLGTGCQPDSPVATDTCRLSSVTDQLVETSGKLTEEASWSATYGTTGVSAITTRTASQTATFGIELSDNLPARAVNGQDMVAMSYSMSSLPVSATFTRGGTVQSTFTMQYGAGGVLTRIVESRQVLPANSLTRQRDYTFTYDAAGNLTTERDVFTLRDGLTLAQEETFTFDTRPSPYVRFAYRPLLTVVALAMNMETVPGRFWHQLAPTSLLSYNLNSDGSRADMRENSTFALTYDAGNKLTTREQTALLYQSSVPTPISKKNRQTFDYSCE